MDRIQLINTLIRTRGYRDYLEIGVKGGEALMAIQAERRTGVDPDLHRLKPTLQPGLKGKATRWLRQPFGQPWSHREEGLRLFEMTSDDYFANYTERYDLVFIDGLHQFDQVLYDYRNAQRVLRDGGCIVFHDCNPLTELAAERERHEGNVLWNGDTWKAVYYLREHGQQIRTYDFDHGCGVAFKQTPPADFPKSDIDRLLALPYETLDRDRAAAVGLRSWDEADLSRAAESLATSQPAAPPPS